MIKVGCCGWGFFKGGLKAYAQRYRLVEVQQTFYKLPLVKTAERWRQEVPPDFEFTCKAFQAITHTPSSPTWRRSGIKVSAGEEERYGMLRPTTENLAAWGKIRDICKALRADVCVIQCPPSFSCTPENIKNMRKFFSQIDREELAIAWEPRGDWNEYPEEIKKLCDGLKLIHVVDLMRREPLSRHPISYVRLHGLNPREYDYNYKYSQSEINELAKKLKRLEEKHELVYCMFNNYGMYDDAAKLIKLLEKSAC